MQSFYLPRLWMLMGIVAVMSPACRKQPKSSEVDEQETESDTDPEKGSDNSGTESDAAIDEETQYYEHQQERGIGNETFGSQDTLVTYSISMCKNERLNVNEGISPYILIGIYFHEGYPLIGTHFPDDQTPDVQDAADPDYRQGFYAGYSPNDYTDEGDFHDQFIWAESGTVTVSEENGRYKLTYDIVFSDEIHETGGWFLELCGTPYNPNP